MQSSLSAFLLESSSVRGRLLWSGPKPPAVLRLSRRDHHGVSWARDKVQAKKKGIFAAAAWGGTILLAPAGPGSSRFPASRRQLPDLQVVLPAQSGGCASRDPLSAAAGAPGRTSLRLGGPLVVVAEQVAEAVDGQALELRPRAACRCARRRAVSTEITMSPSRCVAGRIGLARQLLQVKAEHVGRAIVLR